MACILIFKEKESLLQFSLWKTLKGMNLKLDDNNELMVNSDCVFIIFKIIKEYYKEIESKR